MLSVNNTGSILPSKLKKSDLKNEYRSKIISGKAKIVNRKKKYADNLICLFVF